MGYQEAPDVRERATEVEVEVPTRAEKIVNDSAKSGTTLYVSMP
jgi:hypothetical protein